MPCVVYVSLKSVADVDRSLVYCGSASHPNHEGYTVESPRVYGDPSTKAFLNRLDYGLEFLNRERSRSHQLTVAARWWVGAFKKGSFPSKEERRTYEATLVRALGCKGWYASSWHLHRDGSADLNIFDPGIDYSGKLPLIRRSRRINLLIRARAASDDWSLTVNSRRSKSGDALISTPVLFHEGRRKERGEPSIEELLAEARGLKKLDHSNLPKALDQIGLKRNEWEVSSRGHLLLLDRIPGRTKRRGRRSIRVIVSYLFQAVNLRIKMEEVVSGPQEADPEVGEGVIRSQWTAIEVIQPLAPGATMGM